MAIALVPSFGTFLAPDLAGAPGALYAVLASMHLAAAIIICGIPSLASARRRRPPTPVALSRHA